MQLHARVMDRTIGLSGLGRNMYFRQVLHETGCCASYIVGCPAYGACAVVDPQGEIQPYIDEVENNAMAITHVIDTHVHADHESAARTLATAANASLYLGNGAEVAFDFIPLSDGEVLEIGNRRVQVMHTPGHTPEHVSLVFDDSHVLTGDTLFVGDVGRIDLALANIDEFEIRSRATELYGSLRSLLSLEDEIKVYPGHYAGCTGSSDMDGESFSTIGRERRTNPALQLEPDQFLDYQLANSIPLPEDFRKIKTANKS